MYPIGPCRAVVLSESEEFLVASFADELHIVNVTDYRNPVKISTVSLSGR